MIIILRHIPGISFDKHLGSLLDRPDEVKRLRSRFINLASDFQSKYHLIHGDIRPANVIYQASSDTMTLIDFGSTITDEEAAEKNGWNLRKDTERSAYGFDVCIGMHRLYRLKIHLANGLAERQELVTQLVDLYYLVKYALGGTMRKTRLMRSIKEDADFYGVNLYQFGHQNLDSVPQSILGLLNGDVIDGKYQVNIGDGIYRIYEELYKWKGVIVYRADTFTVADDPTVGKDVVVGVFLPGPNQKRRYETELHITKSLDDTRKPGSIKTLFDHDSKQFAQVELLPTEDIIPLLTYLGQVLSSATQTEIKRLYMTIAQLGPDFYARTGFFHGDIRLENVLYGTKDGTMTLFKYEKSFKPPGSPDSDSNRQMVELERKHCEKLFVDLLHKLGLSFKLAGILD
jgi:serine/threonine protein kinase